MDFKKLLILLLPLAFVAACDPGPEKAEGEYLIGKKLQGMSSLNSKTSGEASTVVIFDDTIRKIHQFDLKNMKHLKTHVVRQPGKEHTVLFYEDGNYIIDLTNSHLTVIDSEGRVQNDPIDFVGTPISASFRPDLGYLVIYDDERSVGFLKLSALGQVEKSWVSGPVLSPNISIFSGDMNDNGQLVLALSDNSLGIVDIEQSLDNQTWMFTSISTPFDDMKWIAPIPGQPHQILIRAQQEIALYDINTQSTLDTQPLENYARIYKYSKTVDPHIIFDDGSYRPKVSMAYVQSGQIMKQDIVHNFNQVMLSQLDLANDNWTMVTTKVTDRYSYYDGLNYVRESRTLRKYKFSTLLAQRQKALPANARLQMAPSYMFALYPSELGFATRINTVTDETTSLKLFNLKHIGK